MVLNSGNDEIARIYAEVRYLVSYIYRQILTKTDGKQVIKLEIQVEVLMTPQRIMCALPQLCAYMRTNFPWPGMMMMNMNMNNNTAAVANPPSVDETQVKLQKREVALRAACPMAFDPAIIIPSKQHDAYPQVTF